MTKTTFLKSLLLTIAIGFSSLSVYAQASLPFSYNLGNPTGVAGLTATGLGSNYSASPQMKFDDTNDNLVLNFNSIPGDLSFVIKWNQSTTATRFPGNFSLLESINGTDYTLVQLFNSTTGPELKNGVNVTVTVTNLKPESRFLKWEYTAKSNGNIALGSLALAAKASSTCTASTLSFANATVSKTIGDAAFTIAATSLNTTTAISYESDNTAVATVNAATGEVTLVAAGTAKIKATQAAGTHASVDYCAATAEYTLNVATNVPTITVTEVLPAFAAGIGANDQKTLTVTAANLTTDIALTITGADAAMFTVTNTLPAVGGSATITYSPTAPGAHTATLALNSTGATEVLITLNGTSTLANAVATDATAVGPTSFTANWNAVAGATGYLLNVYTGNFLLNENFASITEGNNTASDGSSKLWSGNANITSVAAAYQAGGAVRLGTSSAVGSITTKAIDLSNATSLNFDVKGWTTVEGNITVTVDELTPITVTYTAKMADTFESKTIMLPAATATSRVKIATTAKRAFIDNVVIGGSSFVHENLALGNVTSYNVTGLTVNTDYYYTVTAKYNDTASAKSNEIKVTTSESTNSAPSATMQSLRKVGNQIIFETSAQQSVEIFNVTGQRLMSTTSVDGVNAITVNTKGLVLVKIGKETAKVIM